VPPSINISGPATVVGFGGRLNRPRVRLLDFRPMRKGKALSVASVELASSLQASKFP
jgi:hypothetical protein